MQYIIKKDDLNYKLKHRKTFIFSKYSLPIAFLKDERHLLLEDAHLKQSKFTIEFKKKW